MTGLKKKKEKHLKDTATDQEHCYFIAFFSITYMCACVHEFTIM